LNKGFENIDDLLGKSLAGETSFEEELVVRDWINADAGNARYFDQMRQVFEKATSAPHDQSFDTDAAWNKVRARIVEPREQGIPISRNRSFTWWYAAASVILIAGIAWFLMRGNAVSETFTPLEVVATSTPIADTLPEGSEVFLNKQTRLKYTYDQRSQAHSVKLAGEAYFNITDSKQAPFIVDAGGVFIRDIGTSFNVRAYPDAQEVEVFVEEGEVQFFTSNDQGVTLKAGGVANYNRKTKSFSIENPEPNIVAYKTRNFAFSNTDLKSIVETLNEVYDRQIIVSASLHRCTMTVSFRNESIEEIAAVLAETLGLSLREENSKLILEGEARE
jgi:transmembrane sensor